MSDFSLVLADEDLSSACCLCGEEAVWRTGPRLVRGDTAQVVCQRCCRRDAPQHWALLDLVQVAERVGRHSRHLLTPSMNSLLELARAAENYTNMTPQRAKTA